jgi:hypothetical protein
MRQSWMIAAAAALLGLSACAANTGRTDATAPTVTYSYEDEDEYDEVAELADDYCDDNYDRDAVLTDREEDDGVYEVIFACE